MQVFVDGMVRHGISSRAAVEAGYQGNRPDMRGYMLKARPHVMEAIEERTAQAIAEAGADQSHYEGSCLSCVL